MAVPTVHIGGHVRGPGGIPPIYGTITARLSQPATGLDGAEAVRIVAERVFKVGATGAVSMDLEPNDVLTPSGTHWLISYDLRLPGGRHWGRGGDEKLQIPSGGDLDFGAVPRIDEASGAAYTVHEAVQASVLASATASASAASASAAAAAASEGGAAASESNASGYALSALSARDMLAVAGIIRPDIASGVSGGTAVADGAFFAVPAAAPYDDFLILYQRSGSSAVEKGRSIGAGSVNVRACLDYAWHVEDSAGNVSLGIKPDGTVVWHTADVTNVLVEVLNAIRQIVGSSEMSDQFVGRFVKSLSDGAGNAALGVRPDGSVEMASLQVGEVNGQRMNPTPAVRNWGAEINHVISYGQSLALGSNASPIQTAAQRHDSLRFVGGVRPSDGASYASLVALVETQSGVLYETPVGGACEALHDTVLVEDGLTYAAHAFTLLGSAEGQSGQTVNGLSKGSANYTNLMAHVTNGLARAVALGKTYKVLGVLWSQGEADAQVGTSASTYRAQLAQLITDLNTDIKAATGQADDVHLIGYQFSSWKVYGGATWAIPLALLAEANSNPLFHIVGPNYHMPHATDLVHLTGPSSKRLGAYYGRALKRVAVNGGEPPLLQPVAAHRSGAVAVLRFDVPVAPLVLDTTTVTAATNSGFELVDSGGSPLTLSSVALLGDNRVKLTAAATIPAGAKVRYAATGTGTTGPVDGPRGNLRDSAGDREMLDPDRVAWPLHNWCCHFEYAL